MNLRRMICFMVAFRFSGCERAQQRLQYLYGEYTDLNAMNTTFVRTLYIRSNGIDRLFIILSTCKILMF